MKRVALLLSALGLGLAFNANAQVSKASSDVRTGVQTVTEAPAALLGEPASSAEATRTVTISPNTRFVNVARGEVIAFRSGGQAFAVRFDGANGVSSFNLQLLAPAGALDHPVTVYVAQTSTGGGY